MRMKMSVAEDAKAEAIRVETVASGVADTMVDLNGPVSEEQLDAIAAAASTHGASEGVI